MTLAFRSWSSTSTNTATLTLTVPSGVADGDELFAHFNARRGTFSAAPAGWTLLKTDVGSRLYKRVASSEPASYNWTFVGGTYAIVGGMSAYTGFTDSWAGTGDGMNSNGSLGVGIGNHKLGAYTMPFYPAASLQQPSRRLAGYSECGFISYSDDSDVLRTISAGGMTLRGTQQDYDVTVAGPTTYKLGIRPMDRTYGHSMQQAAGAIAYLGTTGGPTIFGIASARTTNDAQDAHTTSVDNDAWAWKE